MKQLTAYRKPRDPGYVGGFYWTPTIVGFIGLFLTNVVATQFVAWRFEYQSALGPALIHVGSFYLYAPYKWLVWVWAQGSTGDIRIKLPLLLGAGIIVGGAFASGVLFFLLNLARTKALSKNTEDLHGSARWATKADILETNLMQHHRACMSEAGTNSPSGTTTTCGTTARSISSRLLPRGAAKGWALSFRRSWRGQKAPWSMT